MDSATKSSVVPVSLTDSSSQARETTERSRTGTAILAHGQLVATPTSESTITPVPSRPLSYVEHTQAVESGTGTSSTQVDPTPLNLTTRSTSDPASQTSERHLSSKTNGPYPARYSRRGAQSASGEFDHLARGTSRGRDFLPRRATLQRYPSLPSDLVPKTTSQLICTVRERLQPTVQAAEHEKAKYAAKAKWTSYALNIAIGLQVLLASLTTGLSAVAIGKQASVMIVILGALATLVASYLARMRGSNEPELSITRVKDLDQFLRECKAFQLDHGNESGTSENGLNKRVEEFRSRFEDLLGNGDGQRRLSAV
ncbi:uncharacterized protein EDB93DRAFT_1124133 [Suillus bovinus]|uniref:uncharacterized protein n=1 Tax=Suillus bovinus TaxID=48563 RepID=UPI001B877D3A|nr:uncharacterized protein EDB93DRAFT_1124133 [Suillus bovinus]KAG2157691.1 hypothetical protein EDB93DRAFT_1124133 [Suillus bovinus]